MSIEKGRCDMRSAPEVKNYLIDSRHLAEWRLSLATRKVILYPFQLIVTFMDTRPHLLPEDVADRLPLCSAFPRPVPGT